MTIGIATRGTGAGLAAYHTLQAAEALGHGSIGGFAVFVWREADGGLRHATTQDHGSRGLTLSEGWREAGHAALISSGPNRPAPLLQFLPADGAVGLVTGHRLPSSPLPDGAALNAHALARMAAGGFDQAGLEALLASAPGLDAGLICLPLAGPCLIADAPRVRMRGDLGRFLHDGTATCAILHNSIHTAQLHGNALAAALGGIALEVMGQTRAAHVLTTLPDRLPVRPAAAEAVELDTTGAVRAVHSADPAYAGGRPRITAIYASTPVVQGGARVGTVLSEVFSTLEPWLLVQDVARHFVWRRDPPPRTLSPGRDPDTLAPRPPLP